MRDHFRLFPLLFSLGIHGVMASLLMFSIQDVPKLEIPTIQVQWEKSSQVISREIPHLHQTSSSKALEKSVMIQKSSKRQHYDGATAPLNNKKGMDKKPSSQTLKKGVVNQKHCHGPISLPTRLPENGEREVETSVTASNHLAKTQFHKDSTKKSYQPLPKYPWISRKRGHTGRVYLLIKTNEEGCVIAASVHKSSGHVSLDKAALNAVKLWILPAVSQQKVLSIAFRLKD